MRKRLLSRRGIKKGGLEEKKSLESFGEIGKLAREWLLNLESRGLSERTLKSKDYSLRMFIRWSNSLGISQRELARQLGVSQSNVGFWEKNKTLPKVNLIPKLAKVLSVQVEELIGIKTKTKTTDFPTSRLGKAFKSVKKLPRRQQSKIVDVVEAFVAQNSKAS